MITVSQIHHRKWQAEGGFSVTKGKLDRIRHDQCWLAEGGIFSVTNLGNLDRIRQDQGWLAERGFSMTNLVNLDRVKLLQLPPIVLSAGTVLGTSNCPSIRCITGDLSKICSNVTFTWLPLLCSSPLGAKTQSHKNMDHLFPTETQKVHPMVVIFQ